MTAKATAAASAPNIVETEITVFSCRLVGFHFLVVGSPVVAVSGSGAYGLEYVKRLYPIRRVVSPQVKPAPF
jgi:hypothetical protein